LLEAREGVARSPKQERSAQRQRLITDAAIAVIAEHGLANVTHRLVANRAGVSLAATTYYFKTKADIVCVASAQLLAGYVDAFSRFAERRRADEGFSFRDFVIRAVMNATDKHRTGSLAWCEIVLDGARHQETRTLARIWFARLFEVWSDIAQMLGVEEPASVARSAIDTLIGLLLIVIPLGLTESQVLAVLRNGADPHHRWPPSKPDESSMSLREEGPTRKVRKAEKTREKILAAAMALLIEKGPSGVTYRAISNQAGMTPTAPIYYYPSIESLLKAAQVRIFQNSKDRYRLVMAGVDPLSIDVERVADLTATVFVREATELGPVSLVDYLVRLEAARHPALRSAVWGFIDDQNRAWGRLLRPLSKRPQPLDALLMQSLFVGKLVRSLAVGATTLDLSTIRSEFRNELKAVTKGGHWLLTSQKVVRKIKTR
jgi:AcrR family transcriptional regulator